MEKLSQEQCYVIGAQVAHDIINGIEKEAAWKDHLPFTDKSPEYYDDDIEYIKGLLATKDENGHVDSNYTWTDEKLLAAAAATSAGLGFAGAATGNPIIGAAGIGAGIGGLAGYAGNKVQRYHLNRHPGSIKGYLRDLKQKQSEAKKRVAMEKEAGWKDVAAGVAMTGAGLASTGAKAGFTDDAAKYLSGAKESISRTYDDAAKATSQAYEKYAPQAKIKMREAMYDGSQAMEDAGTFIGKKYDQYAPQVERMGEDAFRATKHGIQDTVENGSQVMDDIGSAVSRKVSDGFSPSILDKGRYAIEDAARAVKHGGQDAIRNAGQAVEDAGVAYNRSAAKPAIESGVESIKNAARNVGHDVEKQYYKAKNSDALAPYIEQGQPAVDGAARAVKGTYDDVVSAVKNRYDDFRGPQPSPGSNMQRPTGTKSGPRTLGQGAQPISQEELLDNYFKTHGKN